MSAREREVVCCQTGGGGAGVGGSGRGWRETEHEWSVSGA